MIGRTNAISQTGVDTLSLLLQKKLTEYTVPDGVTEIPQYCFYDAGANTDNGVKITLPDSVEVIKQGAFSCGGMIEYNGKYAEIIGIPKNLKVIDVSGFECCLFTPIDVVLPEGVTTIGKKAFRNTKMESIVIPSTVKSLPDQCFSVSQVKTVTVKNGLETFEGRAFEQCRQLTTAYIPNSIKSVHSVLTPFQGCNLLEFLTIENGFNANNLNLSDSTKYSAETIVSWLEALADRTGQDTYTLTIGATNLAKLTAEDIAIATSKNWTLA